MGEKRRRRNMKVRSEGKERKWGRKEGRET